MGYQGLGTASRHWNEDAQSDPTLRDMWSKLIGYHPTEWRYHRPTETRYARILTSGPRATADHRAFNEGLLKQEVQRFRALRFWEDLDPKLPESLYHFHPVRFVEHLEESFDYYIDDEGFIKNAEIIKNQISKLERGNIIGPNAIVLHRTASKGNAQSVINYWDRPDNSNNVGAHFIIDKNGTIYQVASLKKYANHVGMIRPRCKRTRSCPDSYLRMNNHQKHIAERTNKNYPDRYPYNNDSIGIEVVAWYNYDTKEWDPATQDQLISVKKLVLILQNEYRLNNEDIYQHQCISYKTSGEGKGLYPPADTNGNVDPSCY